MGSNNCEGRGWEDSTGHSSMLNLTVHTLEWGWGVKCSLTSDS